METIKFKLEIRLIAINNVAENHVKRQRRGGWRVTDLMGV